MHRVIWVVLVAFLSTAAAAGDDVKAENEKLKRRVEQLERAALTEDVEGYLVERAPSSAEGGSPLLPGGLTIAISGEVRVREEIKDRLYSPMDADGARSFAFAHMRTRLRFDIGVLDNLDVVIELQDVRELGDGESTTADTEGVDLKRGTIIFRDVGGKKVDVELGRFVMFYGAQRLVGHLEWFDQGRTYDGIRARYKPDGYWIDVFAVQVRETMMNEDQSFFGVYGGREWFEAYALVFKDQRDMAGELAMDDTLFVTLGFRIARKTKGWDYSLEVAFQTGDVKGDDLSAYAMAITTGYTFEDARWKPRVGIEVAFASGDENPTDGNSEQFQTLFPTNHLHYGYADLVGWSNIIDIRVGVTLQACDTVTVSFDYHHFMRPEDTGGWVNAGGGVIRPGVSGVSDSLGDELDLTVVWKPRKPLSFLFGYSVFLPGGFVEATGPSPTSHFIYLQTRVKF